MHYIKIYNVIFLKDAWIELMKWIDLLLVYWIKSLFSHKKIAFLSGINTSVKA